MRPPAARVATVRETHFGVAVEDPYRWMETGSDEFDSWLAGEAAYARRCLEDLPDRVGLLDRIRTLRAGGGAERRDFAFAGGLTFCLWADPDAPVPVLVVVTGDDGTGAGPGRVLFDPATLAGPAHSHLDWYVPSPDGRHVACAVSSGGNQTCTLHVVEVATGTTIEASVGDVTLPFLSWLDDGRSFVYHQFADAPPDARLLDSRSRRHALGTDAARDPVVLARGLNPRIPLTPRDCPFVHRPPGSDRVLAVISHSALPGDRTDEQLTDCTLYVAPLAGLADPASCPWVRVAGPADAVVAFAAGREHLYLVSRRDAPRGRVVAVPLGDPDPARATVVVPESDRVVEAVRIAGDRLLVRDLDAGLARLRRVRLDTPGAPAEEIALPFEGTVTQWSGAPDRPTALLCVESWAGAPRVHRYAAATGAVTETRWSSPAPATRVAIESYRIEAPARDGTLVPISVTHRAGLARDGANPTLLTGYGSYGTVFTPQFRSLPALLAWVEGGGVWAVAHIRGGGEYGRQWHHAGRLDTKENTITDFIDCAGYLVARGYTAPSRLGAVGGSAGAVPVGGAMVRRPDLFAAVVLHVPVVDTLRIEFCATGPINVPEFGTVTTAEGLRRMLVIDSYRRVRDGTRYPAVLLTTGRNDPQVPCWQAAKMAARLRAASGSGRPVLLRVEEQGGHGGAGATTGQRDGRAADELAFLRAFLTGPGNRP